MLLNFGSRIFQPFKASIWSFAVAGDATTYSSRLCRTPSCQDSVPQLFRVKALKSLNLYEVTIEDLQAALSDGSLTSVEYVRFCLDRICAVDPYLESVIEVNPEALDIAACLDDERRRGTVRGVLHGVPVLVKDNMATKDKMQTTAGSWALLGSVVPRDAHVVTQLRKAGAIIIGHANMSEWASVRSKKYSTGYSPRGGQVRNPYDLSSSPFGSSSGSAVAVSANLVPLSFGTETDTSIIGPAGINGIVGMKPTVGLTSRGGVIPISENLDTVGSLGRIVADAVHGLNAIASSDNQDKSTLSSSRAQEEDYTKFLSSKSVLKGAKFGLPWKRCWEFVPQSHKDSASRVFDAIAAAGGEILHTEFPCAEERIPEDGTWNWEFGKTSQAEFTVVKVDAYNGINAYLSQLSGTRMKTIEDIVKYNAENSGSEGANPGDHSAFPSGQDNFREIVQTQGIKDENYHNALSYIQKKSRKEGIDAALKHVTEDGQTIEFDALLLCDRKGVGQQMAAQAGYPIICIPIGLDAFGIPVSLSLLHSAWKEGPLIKWASAIEDLLNENLG